MEALAQELTAQHPATEVRGVHQYLPSVPRQQASFALVNQHLYSPGAALSQLCSQLGGACQPPAHGAFQPLQLTDLLGSPLAKFMPPFGFDTQREQWVGVFLLKGDLSSSAFTDWVAKTPDLFLYDEAALLSTQMASYRQWATGMLALALVLLCGALLLIYRARALRVLPALGLAILVPVALVSVFGGLTVFHVMALLLVVGIGIDTALFYLEAGLNEETWGASSLSALTSMLAFGLLALSQVPILHQFGIIILLGLMVCWAVSPLLHTPRDVHPCEDSE